MKTRALLGLGAAALLSWACGSVGGAADDAQQPLAGETTLFANVTPATASDSDSSAVELGVKFQSSTDGKLTGLRFYKGGSSNRGPHTGHLWSADGKSLGAVSFANEGTRGWQTARFATPVAIHAGTVYVASYFAPAGHYAATDDYFANSAHVSGPLTALKNGSSGPNGVYRYGSQSGFPTQTFRSSNYFVDVLFVANATPPPGDAGTPPPPPDAGTPPLHDAGTPTPPLDAGTPSQTGFPDATTTGIPAGTQLSTYTGPMTITTDGTVVDGKSITGDLRIKAKNVVVKNSKVMGDVRIDPDDSGYSFTIQDSEVNGGRALGQDAYDGTGIGARDFTALRVHVFGGKRGINCNLNCTVRDSYIHGQSTDETGITHESAMRMGQHSTLIHNTLLCDAPDVPPDAGCSADLTGYGDFTPVEHNLIQNNLFKATTGGACAYGGSSQGKPYSNDANDIHYVDNVFERGTHKSDHGTLICGYYFTVADFNASAPNNLWSNNKFDDGTTVNP